MEKVIEIAKCPICKKIATQAVESNCCATIYCESCSAKQEICPNCNYKPSFSRSWGLIRIIDMLPEPCTHCGEELLHNAAADHEKICPLFPQTCSICKATILAKDLIPHLSTSHQDFITNNIFKEDQSFTLLGPRLNKVGRISRLGANGKFYCGGTIDYPCGCCEGNCGPEKGCNCIPCMMLDCELRSLPKAFYVNKIGIICRNNNKGIYCGGRFNEGILGTDGYCGPTNGPKCEYCKIFQRNFRFIQAGFAKYK